MDAIIIGQCKEVERIARDKYVFTLNFQGPYRGSIIKKIKAYSGTSCLESGSDYLIHLWVNDVTGSIISGNILRYKNIECLRKDIF